MYFIVYADSAGETRDYEIARYFPYSFSAFLAALYYSLFLSLPAAQEYTAAAEPSPSAATNNVRASFSPKNAAVLLSLFYYTTCLYWGLL